MKISYFHLKNTIMKVIVLLLFIQSTAYCWDTDDFEIFDAVEEINQNFYDLMGISQDAKLSDVKKAYRTLSKQLHPDKNDAPDAEVQFRNLVTVYEVLRDEGKRERYNRVLIEGIPDWRSPIYYYRRARKMSMLEISIILIVVISIAQYLMAWGSYLDKRHTLEDFLLRKLKVRDKDKRKKKPEDSENLAYIAEQLNNIEKPKWWKILPIQTVQFIIFLVLHGPRLIKDQIADAKERKRREEELIRKKEENEKRLQEEEEERERKKAELKEKRKVERKRIHEIKRIKYESQAAEEKEAVPVIVGGPWTDEEFSELARLMAKFPGGTKDRWEKIAAQLNRTVYEVTKMSNIVKDKLTNRENVEEIQLKVKQKTKGGKTQVEDGDINLGSDDLWNATQQKTLEKALKKYPKGTDERWDKIANCVPEKSKEECMMRFKYLAEKIKKKKEEESQAVKESEETEEIQEENEAIEKYEESQNSECSKSDHDEEL